MGVGLVDAKLTVAVPTYNRSDILRKNLSAAVESLPLGVAVLVVDNCSEPPLDLGQDLIRRFAARGIQLRIVRNASNLGGGANILRCFELVNTEWFALCGDDDNLVPEGLRELLTILDSCPTAAFVKCSSRFHRYEVQEQGYGVSSLLSRSGDYNSLLFMSSSVYRKSLCLPYLRFGYLMTGAYAPHVAMALLAVRKEQFVLSPAQYANANESDPDWSPIDVALSAYGLADLPLLASERRALMRKIYASHRPAREILDLLTARQLVQAKEEVAFLRRKALRVHLFFGNGLKAVVAVIGLLFLPIMGSPGRWLFAYLYRWRTGRRYERRFVSRHHGL